MEKLIILLKVFSEIPKRKNEDIENNEEHRHLINDKSLIQEYYKDYGDYSNYHQRAPNQKLVETDAETHS